ncbi:YheO-like PAS domain protein [Peptococcaceae bacterium CEB3]|nr:YheO-like PAS domain protein [Peptococcaceae bacterium CEB3]
MSYKELLNMYIPLVDFIADIIGSHCEVLLHDIVDVENSVIAIRNGYISGRYIGCPLTDLGLKLLENKAYSRQNAVVNYRSRTADGKKLISSTYYIKDDQGELIGMLCVNILDAPDHPITRMPSRLPLAAVANDGVIVSPQAGHAGDRRERGKEGVQGDGNVGSEEDGGENVQEGVQQNAQDNEQENSPKDLEIKASGDLKENALETTRKTIRENVQENIRETARENTLEDARVNAQADAGDDPQEEVAELLSTSLDQVVNDAVKKVMAKYEVSGERMSTEEKSAVVRELRESGIFKIKGAITKVAKALKTSESTIYRYLAMK